jgi:putative ABC transport system substrate-binding protein
LPALVGELVRRKVAVIVAAGSSAPGLAAKAATTTIPIVFQTGGDPIEDGLVKSMNRPDGNITGVSRMNVSLDPKRLELLHEAVPRAAVIAFLLNPRSPRANVQAAQLKESAHKLGLRIEIAKVNAESELDAVFSAMAGHGVGALLVGNDPVMTPWAKRINALSVRHAIPTMATVRSYATAGGLMSYDASITDSYRQVGIYAGRMLKGEKPADLPVLQPTKFVFIINLKTARAIKIDIPARLLALADEVIE